MSPFTPIGDQARWKIVYELFSHAAIGAVVTYAAIGEALDLDPADERHIIQMSVRRAAKELLTADCRAIEVVRNEGYAIVEPSRQLALATGHQKRARRSIRRGHDQVTYVDVSALDESTRQMFEIMAYKFGQQDEAIRRLDVRHKRMERQVETAISASQRTAEELEGLKTRLAALEDQRGE